MTDALCNPLVCSGGINFEGFMMFLYVMLKGSDEERMQFCFQLYGAQSTTWAASNGASPRATHLALRLLLSPQTPRARDRLRRADWSTLLRTCLWTRYVAANR